MRRLFVVVFGLTLLCACAAQQPQPVQPDEEAVGAVVSQPEQEAPRAPVIEETKETLVEEPEKKQEVDPCEAVLVQAIQQARASMGTVKKSCNDLVIEVNPMWDMAYQGRVHIRVYDGEGSLVRDEYQD